MQTLKELLACVGYVIFIFLCWLGILLIRVTLLPANLFEAGKEHASREPRTK
jgi:hypothetical protein